MLSPDIFSSDRYRHTPESQNLNVEVVETLKGAEAERKSKEILAAFQKDRFPLVTELPTIDLAAPVREVKRIMINDRIQHENVYKAGATIPVDIRKEFYLIETENHGNLVFSHEINAVVPTVELHQRLHEMHKYPEYGLHRIATTYGSYGTQSEIEAYVEAHAEIIQQVNSSLSIERLLTLAQSEAPKIRNWICLLALPPNPHRTKSKADLFIYNALRSRIGTLRSQDLQIKDDRFLDEHLSSLTYLPYLTYYDTFPYRTEAIQMDQIESKNDVILQRERSEYLDLRNIARMYWDELTQATSTHLNNVDLKPLYTYMANVYALIGSINEIQPLVHIPYLPQTEYAAYVMRGMAASEPIRMIRFPQVAAQIAATSGLSAELCKMLIERVNTWEMIYRVDSKVSKPDTSLSLNAAEWIHLKEIQNALRNGIQEHTIRELALDPHTLFGKNVPIDIANVPPTNEEVKVENKALSQSMWGLPLKGFTLDHEYSFKTYIELFRRMQSTLQGAFYQRQMPPYLQPQAIKLLEFIHEDVETAQTHAIVRDASVELELLTNFTNRIKYVSYHHMYESLRLWVARGIFAEQTFYLYKAIKELGYNVASTASPSSNETISITDNHVPFHLTAEKAGKLLQLKQLIHVCCSFKDSINNMTLQSIATKMRQAEKSVQPLLCEYQKYDYSRKKSIVQKYTITESHHDIITEWIAKAEGNSWQINERLAMEVIEDVAKDIQEAILALNQNSPLLQKKRKLVDAYHKVSALHELCTLLPYSGGLSFELSCYFDSIEHLKDIIALMDERIVPMGEVELLPRKVLLLLGPNAAGKSTVMRDLAMTTLLSNHTLPQLGEAKSPKGIMVDSIIGQENQRTDHSLGSIMVPGLNRIAQSKIDQPTLWALDELGGRMSDAYGLSVALVSCILAAQTQNYVVVASHYHEYPQFAPLLTQLGITLDTRVVEKHRQRPLKNGEKTNSHALTILQRHVPGSWLRNWKQSLNDHSVSEQTNREYYTRKQIEVQWIKDLYAEEDEYVFPTKAAGKDSFLFELFKDVEKASSYQALITEVGDIIRETNALITLKKAISLLNLHNPRTTRGMPGYQIDKMICDVLGLTFQLQSEENKEQQLTKTTEIFNDAQIIATQIAEIAAQYIPGIIAQTTVEEFTYNNLRKMSQGGIEFLSLTLSHINAICTLANHVTSPENGFCKVELTSEPIIKIEGLWNNLLSHNHHLQTTNSVSINYSDPQVGTIITGETSAGKSNHARALSNFLWLSRIGYGPAKSATINPNILVVSLTQPVNDTNQKSSFEVETLQRLKPAVFTPQDIQNRLVLTIFDEPATQTSSTDSTATIVALYKWYHQHPHAKLITTTHRQKVPTILEQQGIPVEKIAFHLLPPNRDLKPYTAVPGVVDSNTIEVARARGLDELPYQMLKMIYPYVISVLNNTVDEHETQDTALKMRRCLLGLLTE